jgi:hypothetical protein
MIRSLNAFQIAKALEAEPTEMVFGRFAHARL